MSAENLHYYIIMATTIPVFTVTIVEKKGNFIVLEEREVQADKPQAFIEATRWPIIIILRNLFFYLSGYFDKQQCDIS
ncbi:unnamed protein product [Larinioides sclopetarius]|uniref:Photosystem II protein M n=1 Tax=Larinioides sclopetarius TaxID=280406 RepID=A0AAV1Z3Z5_9ARAC